MNVKDFDKPEKYYMKLKEIDDGIEFILDEYKKLYVLSNLSPEKQEYQQQFSNIENNVTKINSKLFSLSNDISNNIDLITKYILYADGQIKLQKNKKKELKKKLGIVENKTNASSEMIYDYKEIYNKRYLRNWAMIISIISGILVIKWMVKKPVV
jgi:hypothetical protein